MNSWRWKLQLFSFVFAALGVSIVYHVAPEAFHQKKTLRFGVTKSLEEFLPSLKMASDRMSNQGPVAIEWVVGCKIEDQIQACLRLSTAPTIWPVDTENVDPVNSSTASHLLDLFDRHLIPSRLVRAHNVPVFWRPPTLVNTGSLPQVDGKIPLDINSPSKPQNKSTAQKSAKDMQSESTTSLGDNLLEWVVLELAPTSKWKWIEGFFEPQIQLEVLQGLPGWNTTLRLLENSSLPAERKASALRSYTLTSLSYLGPV